MVTIMGSHGSDFIASKCSRWMRSLTRWSERSLFSERFRSSFPIRPCEKRSRIRRGYDSYSCFAGSGADVLPAQGTLCVRDHRYGAVSISRGKCTGILDCLRRLLCYHHQPSPDWTWTDSVQAIYPRRWGQLSELLISEICTQPIA